MGHSSNELAEKISWYLGIMLVLNCCQTNTSSGGGQVEKVKKICNEILYVVGEGETLQSIGEKCGDPYIVEFNPHIHDPDDVFPGILIKITPKFTTI